YPYLAAAACPGLALPISPRSPGLWFRSYQPQGVLQTTPALGGWFTGSPVPLVRFAAARPRAQPEPTPQLLLCLYCSPPRSTEILLSHVTDHLYLDTDQPSDHHLRRIQRDLCQLFGNCAVHHHGLQPWHLPLTLYRSL